ncbi:MAG: hypothetical protein Q9M82_03385 [Mariprofundus sp.]|nr:hypothetical protein [Mariprofundus sp.]
MSTGLRNILVAGVVLLAIGATLSLRLNSDKISQHFYQQLQLATASRLSAGHVELTFMHGIGLRLDTVVIKYEQYQLRAKHMNISLRLLPLLLGKFQTDLLDIHDAVIIIQPISLTPTSAAISSLPVPRIRLVRSRIQTAAGKTVLDNLYLEMRNIGPDSKTLWELKAKQGKQALSGNGRLLFHAGQIKSGFSKLKMEHFQLARLEPFAPHALITWLQSEGSLLSGAVTLDINKQQSWALFGEVGLEREPQNTAHSGNHQADTILKLRGKLSHSADGALVWRDSFIHLGEQAVVTIDGACQPHGDCNTRLDAKNVPLSEWAAFMPAGIAFYDHMSGMTDLKASLQWNQQQWTGNILLQLRDSNFNDGHKIILLPTLRLQTSELSGNAAQWHTQANIRSPQAEGSIQIRNSRHNNGDIDLFIDSQDADADLWVPLSNMMLTTLNLKPALQAVGKIHGKLHLHQHGDKQSLSLDADATETQVSYAAWLNKAAQIVAQCKARLDLSDSRIISISLQQCQLDASSVNELLWSRRKSSQKLSLNKLDLRIEQFSALLPENMQDLTGQLQGSGTAIWKDNESWLRNMSGQWKLKDIANKAWHADGSVRVKAGVFSSNQLLIDGIYGKAELFGSFDPSRKRGDIDIIAGQLDWNSTPVLGSFWQQLSIQGRIYKARLALLDNDWQNIQGYYTFSHGQLQLNKLEANLADGQFSSTELTLTPSSEGIDIQGDIRSKNIQLQKLSRLHLWLGAAIDGKLQANIKVHGRIGKENFADWQHSNGDILIYDGRWKQPQKPSSLTEKPGISSPALQSYAFSKFDFRFRVGKDQMTLPHITLIHMDNTYSGSAVISSELHITGMLRSAVDKSAYALDSILPQINLKVQ